MQYIANECNCNGFNNLVLFPPMLNINSAIIQKKRKKEMTESSYAVKQHTHDYKQKKAIVIKW